MHGTFPDEEPGARFPGTSKEALLHGEVFHAAFIVAQIPLGLNFAGAVGNFRACLDGREAFGTILYAVFF